MVALPIKEENDAPNRPSIKMVVAQFPYKGSKALPISVAATTVTPWGCRMAPELIRIVAEIIPKTIIPVKLSLFTSADSSLFHPLSCTRYDWYKAPAIEKEEATRAIIKITDCGGMVGIKPITTWEKSGCATTRVKIKETIIKP